MFRLTALGLLSAPAFAVPASTAHLDPVQVTATRDPEPINRLPASMSVVTADELRARGAVDLRMALTLVAGVEGTPGGDGGPSGSVPALWGLRELDAFLLVIDGVPWGGAFNPATPSVDLVGVERIEILRGAAPVMFGATAFVGVIHVIHAKPGGAATAIAVTAGSHASVGASVVSNLPQLGAYQQSMIAHIEQRGFRDERTRFDRYHALYRGAADWGATHWHVDGDVSVLRQDPAGNLLLRDGNRLHAEMPRDANFNPTGAHLNQERYHLAGGLEMPTRAGNWQAKIAITRNLDDILRGFLRGTSFSDPPDGGVGDGLQADGFTQSRGLTDLYVDAHLTSQLSAGLQSTVGVDYLHGRGSQHAVNFGYCIDANAVETACDGAYHADELVASRDARHFAGLYAQLEWVVAPAVDLLAGLRLNHARETVSGRAIEHTGASPIITLDGADARTDRRVSGTLGLSWRAWTASTDSFTIYADYRNSFKPLAVDFGPEAQVDLLNPETSESYEFGSRWRALEGGLDVDASVFRMDFRNGLTYLTDDGGNPVPANGGKSRFQGFEVQARLAASERMLIQMSYAYHDARFVRFTRDNGTDASGHRIEMSPKQVAGIGLSYRSPSRIGAMLAASYVGGRMLNKSNTVEAGGYSTVDAALDYSLGSWRVQLRALNLTDRRDPVAESELQGLTATGTAGYYRLPARSLELTVEWTP